MGPDINWLYLFIFIINVLFELNCISYILRVLEINDIIINIIIDFKNPEVHVRIQKAFIIFHQVTF